MTRTVKRAQLTAVARDHFGVDLTSLTPVDGGLDERARIWRGTTGDGESYSVKASRRDCRFGLAVASSLAHTVHSGVARPLTGRNGVPWVEHRGHIVSLVPWIDGTDAATAGADRVSWEHFGALLRAVHEQPPPFIAAPVRRGIRRSSLRSAVLIEDVDDRLAQIDARVATGDGAATTASAFWAAQRGRIADLAAAERRLKRERRSTRRVTLHGDPHLGNIVIAGDGHPWLIDFDESTVAPREADLMLIRLGVIFSSPVTDAQRASFAAGYGTAEVDEERIARFACVRAVEDVTATLLRLTDAPPHERPDLEWSLRGQTGPDGLVTLAEQELRRLTT